MPHIVIIIIITAMRQHLPYLLVLSSNDAARRRVQRAAELCRLGAQMPGINLPASHLLYFLAALAITGIAHEMGHAMAAAWCVRRGACDAPPADAGRLAAVASR